LNAVPFLFSVSVAARETTYRGQALYPGFPRSLPYTVIRLGMPRGPSSYILGLIPSDGTYRRQVPRPYYLNLSSRVVLVLFGLARSRTQEPAHPNQSGNGHAQPQPQNYRLVNYTKAQNIRIAAPGRVRSNDVEKDGPLRRSSDRVAMPS